MRSKIAVDASPYSFLDAVRKFSHVFCLKDRVRIKKDGYTGTITDERHGKWIVQLDSDPKHVVACDGAELEPIDFPAYLAPGPTDKVQKRFSLFDYDDEDVQPRPELFKATARTIKPEST